MTQIIVKYAQVCVTSTILTYLSIKVSVNIKIHKTVFLLDQYLCWKQLLIELS